MEEEVKFYEEVAKKELNVTGSSDSENNVKPVIPVCRVEKSDTGAVFTYLGDDEEKVRDSGEGVGTVGVESPQMRHVGMEHAQTAATGTRRDVLPIDTEIKQEYDDDEEDQDGEFFRLQSNYYLFVIIDDNSVILLYALAISSRAFFLSILWPKFGYVPNGKSIFFVPKFPIPKIRK